jgi:hypothetical protein
MPSRATPTSINLSIALGIVDKIKVKPAAIHDVDIDNSWDVSFCTTKYTHSATTAMIII